MDLASRLADRNTVEPTTTTLGLNAPVYIVSWILKSMTFGYGVSFFRSTCQSVRASPCMSIFSIFLSCQGHDSERLTSLEETTSSGYPRNFILQRKGEVAVQVRE